MTPELWLYELQESITTFEELSKKLTLTEEEMAAFEDNLNLPFQITPHIFSLIKNHDPQGTIRRQFVPRKLNCNFTFSADFLKEDENKVSPNLIQRYPYKAILMVTQNCPAYCRFCTRSRLVGDCHKFTNFEEDLKYLREHSEIYDIVITGGDPLTLSDEELSEIIYKLREIDSISVIRLNTRVPVNLPNRITPNLIKLLNDTNVFVNIHFEHPDEISDKTEKVCLAMANNGIVLGSQSVLLKNINDNETTLCSLFLKLLSIKVKPYYLYQCDKVKGCEYFYAPLQNGIDLINRITPQLPGIAIPKFVVDVPGKIGKCCVAPYGIVPSDREKIVFKNYFTREELIY